MSPRCFVDIGIVSSVKYLGVVKDRTLQWGHLNRSGSTSTRALEAILSMSPIDVQIRVDREVVNFRNRLWR